MRKSQLSKGQSANYYLEILLMLILVYKAYKENNIGEHIFSFTKKTMTVLWPVNAKINQSYKPVNLCVEDLNKLARQESSLSQ